MPGNRFIAFQNHGIGIGLRIPHYQDIFSRKPVVDWFEIISENFMIDGGRPLAMLDQILERYRVVQHGVSLMYFGSVTRTRPGTPQAPQDVGAPHGHSLAQRSSLLGDRSTAHTPTTFFLCPIRGKRLGVLLNVFAWCRTISKSPSQSRTSVPMRRLRIHR